MPALKPELAIRKILTDDATIAALIGARMYPGWASQDAVLPYISYFRASTDPDHYMGGTSGLKMADVDLFIYDDNYDDATDLAELIEAELNTAGHRQTVTISGDSITFSKLFMADQSDDIEVLPDGAGRPRYRVYQRWECAYQDA